MSDQNKTTPTTQAKKRKIKWKECAVQAQYGFYTGFITAATMALGGGLLMSLSPRLTGQRKNFFFKEIPKMIVGGGLGFGSLLYVGGFLRCI